MRQVTPTTPAGDPLARLRNVWRPGGRDFPWVIAAAAAVNLLALALPLLMLQLFDRVLPQKTTDTLVLLVIGTGVAVVLEALLRLLRSSLMAWTAARFEYGAMSEGYARMLGSRGEIPDIHAYAGRFNAIVGLKDHYSGQTLMQFLDLPFTLLFLVLLALIGGWLVLVPLAGVALLALVNRRFAARHRALHQERGEADRRRSSFLFDTLSGIHTVKAMAMESFMLRRYERLHEKCAELTRRLSGALDAASGVGGLFSPLMTVLITAVAGYRVMHGELTNGEMAACLLLSLRSLGPLQRIGPLMLARERVATLREELEPLFKGDAPPTDDEAAAGPALAGALELRDVSLRYPGARSPILARARLVVQPGECLVITGANGSGRSSVLRLMAGLQMPDEGEVLLGGRSLAGEPDSLVRRSLAYIPADARIFQGTVLENITGFDPALTERALEVARELGLEAFVSRMPRGWDSPIGESAAETLPYGHRQRIAMARALARDTSVVLMDSANVAMDSEGDAALRQFIERRHGKTTFVIVTDRPSLQRLADRRVLLQDGGLAESAAALPVSPPPATEETARDAALPMPGAVRPEDTESPWTAIEQVAMSSFAQRSDLAACVAPLLKALAWHGKSRDVAEAFPYFEDALDISGLRNCMARLGFDSDQAAVAAADIDRRLLPCLFVPDGGAATVLLERTGDGQLRCHDTTTGQDVLLADTGQSGQALFFRRTRPEAARPGRWIRQSLGRMTPLLSMLLLSAIVYGLVLLPVPLFVMAVYSSVIPAGSTANLAYLTIGAVAALALGSVFLIHRTRILSFVAGRLDFIFGSSVFRKILELPPAMSENAAIGAQMARLNSFESVRDLFTGPMAATLVELPALLAIAVALGIVNPMALGIVVLTLLAYGGAYLLMSGRVSRVVETMVRSSTRRHELLVETVGKLRSIRDYGGERVWARRFRQASADAAMAAYRAGSASAQLGALAYLLNTMGILAIISASAWLVMEGSLGMGALLASMILSWRLVGPVQTAFSNVTRIDRIRNSMQQMERLMGLRGERSDQGYAVRIANLKGKVEFDRASFRYSMDTDPALVGVSFSVAPGALVAITGPNGGGKSTLLKMMAGLYQPQAGSVRIDDRDLRQLDPVELRRSLGYVPQECSLFYGSIEQNLRFVRPGATDAEIRQALEMAGALDDVMQLPQGLATRTGDGREDQLPSSLRQKLSLARAYLTGSPLLLFDEPANTLDFEGDRHFMQALAQLKGRCTIFLVTQRPSHIRLADTVLLMQGGHLRFAGPPAKALERLGFSS